MQASDRFNINSQLEHLQAKYVGTGHADLTRFEWAVNIQRDSYASYIGHYPMMAYFAIAENESIGRERYNFMQVTRKCSFLVASLLREMKTEPVHNYQENNVCLAPVCFLLWKGRLSPWYYVRLILKCKCTLLSSVVCMHC
ncbi:unnamed protein product [Urochloa humidicola]